MKRTSKPSLEPVVPSPSHPGRDSDPEIHTGDVLSERELGAQRPPSATLPLVDPPTWDGPPPSERSGPRPSVGLPLVDPPAAQRSSRGPAPISTLPAPPDDPPIPLGYIVASAVFLAIAVAGFGLYLAIEIL